MADIGLKQAGNREAVPVRERLRSLDDAGVVAEFLTGEERAFEELVDRYQSRLIGFVYRTVGDCVSPMLVKYSVSGR